MSDEDTLAEETRGILRQMQDIELHRRESVKDLEAIRATIAKHGTTEHLILEAMKEDESRWCELQQQLLARVSQHVSAEVDGIEGRIALIK
jgi:chromosome condensin MukBEF ATPase and DNA-binding subunit MukB